MTISQSTLKEFAKAVAPPKQKSEGTMVTGTAKEYDGGIYVQIDGSEQLTPIASSTAGIKDGDRITVMVKDHKVTATGNVSMPSTNQGDLDDLHSDISGEFNNKIGEFEEVIASKATIEELEAQTARIDTLTADNVTIKETLTAETARINNLEANKANIEDLEAMNAHISNLEADMLTAEVADITYAKIDDLEAVSGDFYTLQADYADFKTVTADDISANTAKIEHLESTMITSDNLDAKYANIDFANIGEAAIEKLFSESGIIGDLVMSDGHVTGTLVGVTIKGDLIEGGTVVADKLVIKGEDGLFYKLNTDGVDISAEQTEYNSLNGSVITAKSITAEKVNVDDLVAFGATIGGFNIDTDSLYSGVKSSVDNTTPGVYMDDTGQFSLGNATDYLKFYKDGSNWKLDISASSIKFGSSSTSLEQTITNIQNAAEAAEEAASNANSNASDAAEKADQLEQSLNDYKDVVAGSYATKAELKVESDQIKATVEETYSTKEEVSAVEDKANAAQDALDSYKSTVSTTYATKSEVTQTADSIKSEVSETYTTKEEFEGLEVGGRNLLYDTKGMTVKMSSGNAQRVYTTYASAVGNGGGLVRTADGIKLTFGSNTRVSIQAPLASFGNVENNETVTLSFTYRGNITSFGNWYFLQQTTPNVSLYGFPSLNGDGQWHEYIHTFSSSSANVRTCVSVLLFYNLAYYDNTKWVEIKEGTLKLERGNKATDWSPAPEDMLSTSDASATYATKTSLSTVEQTVNGLKSTVSSNYTTLNNKFNNYYNKTQVDQKEDAIQLNAQRIAGINYNQAKMIYTDPCFEKGLNGVIVYNLSNNGNVTITRQSGNSSDPFTFSNYRLMIQNKGSSNPGCGGFYFGNQSRANAVFLYRIWALIPVGRNINWRSNLFGTGSNVTWLSSTAGTGAFEEYVCVATCGSTGEFSSIGYFYIDGAVGTSSTPVTWYVAYATCFDVTNKSDYSTLRVDVDSISSRVVDAEGNISSLEQTSSGLEVRLTQAEKDVDTAQSTANAAKTAANNAAKTATNYLKFDSSGLCIGDMTGETLRYNTLIKSTGLHIRNGTADLASFEVGTIDLGGIPIEDAGTQGVLNSKINFAGGSLDSKTYTTSGGRMETQLQLHESRGLSSLLLTADTATLSGPSVTLRADTGQIILSPVIGGVYKKSTSYEMFAARKLYYNRSGTTGNVTLSESAANFDFIDIFFSNNDGYRDCVRVFAPNGNSAVLSNAVYKNEYTTTYVRNKVVTISGTSISVVSNRSGEGQVRQNNSCYAEGSTSIIKIYAVLGWK